MTDERDRTDYAEIAREGYTVWRGAIRGPVSCPSWSELTEEARQAYTAVVMYAREVAP